MGRRAPVLFVLIAVGAVLAVPAASAAPPVKREIRQGLEKVGGFFFKAARKLEQAGLGPGYEGRESEVIYEAAAPRARTTVIAVDPGHRGIYNGRAAPPRGSARNDYQTGDGQPFVPPNFQDHPQPRLYYGNGATLDGRSRLSIPVTPGGLVTPPGREANQRRELMEEPRPEAAAGRDRPSAPLASPSSPPEQRVAPGTAGPVDQGEPVFATRVPGHPGFVYPPGVEHEPKNMLDVRDFAAGQKVKDPRNGRVFLVPPR
jgi:hypothetical protein